MVILDKNGNLILNTIHNGNIFDVLPKIPDESVDCVITSPPYWGKRDYGTISWMGGKTGCDHEAARIKTRFDYALGDTQKAYKETHVKVYVDRCPECGAEKVDLQIGSENEVSSYLDDMVKILHELKRIIKKSGSIWINIGDTYNTNLVNQGTTDKKIPRKSMIGIPFRLSIRAIDDVGLTLRNTIIWHKPNVFPTSVRDRFTDDFEYFFFFTKNQRYYFEQQFEPSVSVNDPRMGKGRIEYDGKMSDLEKSGTKGIQGSFTVIKNKRNKRAVWKIPHSGSEKTTKRLHVAPFPELLIETPIKACVPPNGVVLDPFMGSGTTGSVAIKYGKNYIGIELNKDYVDYATERINNTQIALL